MDKKEAIGTIDNVVRSAIEKFPNFAGVLIYGSFVRENEEFRDIDLMPVYYTAKTDDSQTETRKYLTDSEHSFPKLPEGEYIKNRFGFLQDSIYHVTDSVFLEDLDLKYFLTARHVKNGFFIGNADAERKIEDTLSEKK